MFYTESDTRSKFIDPKLKESGREENSIQREYFFTDGRKLPGNVRAKGLKADYLLRFHGINLAIIEAKAYDHEATEGLEQAKQYGEKLHIRFVYSTNGQQIYEFDLQTGTGTFIENYPSPDELYYRTIGPSETLKQHILSQPYCLTGNMKPRYYQEIAIQKALSALSQGDDRILLTLATGTGKTFIAFQIAYKLFQAKRSKDGQNRRPRILFLADRNILVDQAMNTFNPLEKELVKITGSEIRKRNGKVPTNANIFFAIYQAIVGENEYGEIIEPNVGTGLAPVLNDNPNDNNITNYFHQYPSNFFDLIVIDECHRGGANESGSRHEVLKYFSPAVHLGMTATPKREDNIDTYTYFGPPVYQYSLKEGINDGFLSPYKVKRIQTNIDEIVLTRDDEILSGEATKTLYDQSDRERTIISEERNDLIAQAILDNINPLEKTIVFCVDQGHALRMRDSINKYKQVSEADYCVRVTSDEKEIGRTYLERFQDNDKNIPTILTSSQMLTTGVDARNVRNIVLLRSIGSMVEFKQIIGRGTRIFDGKDFFTILDFTGASNKFYDKERDGEPLPPETDQSIVIASEAKQSTDNLDSSLPPRSSESALNDERRQKLIIRLADGRELKIINVETRYLDEHGRPLSATEFLQQLVSHLPELYRDEDQLRTLRANPETREQLLEQLSTMGIDVEQLANLKRMFEAEDSDIFDILAHISFNADIKKRVQRVAYVKETQLVFEQYENLQAREFLEFILEKYAEYGIEELQRDKLKNLISLYGKNVNDISKVFGGAEKLKGAYYALQEGLFRI